LDKAYEAAKGKDKIGSTLRGIGPAYTDKIGRSGLRIGDVLSPDFKQKYEALKAKHYEILGFYNVSPDITEQEKIFFEAVDFLKKFQLENTEVLINQYLKQDKTILAEGAQGSLLDVDFGTYPFVTSSNTTVAGVCTGLGVAPRHIGKVLGIVKAYTTRVGSGPFPTELFDADGEKLAKEGNEFGSTTGRARRCGWIDIPSLKYVCDLNGVTELLIMKADVLNKFEQISACEAYNMTDGSISETMPYDLCEVESNVYKTIKGWNTDLSRCKSFEDFPEELIDYVAYLEDKLETPVSVVSIGPDRTETIMR
jgi:adenylosuccinate synthase